MWIFIGVIFGVLVVGWVVFSLDVVCCLRLLFGLLWMVW